MYQVQKVLAQLLWLHLIRVEDDLKGKKNTEEIFDFKSKNIFEERQIIRYKIQRRRNTVVGLGTFYLFLTIISIVVLI